MSREPSDFAFSLSTMAQGPSGARRMNIGSIVGVRVHLDSSILAIFLLVVLSLGAGISPQWHPDWSPAKTWSFALAAAVLFLWCVLLHELAHACVARAFGIRVRGVTLCLFGGVAHIEGEPRTPAEEALIAGAGPLLSLIVGVVCLSLGGSLEPFTGVERSPGIMRAASYSSTLLSWLGPVNVFLALFNLLPGLPLDGGRLLRALFWAVTRDVRRATRWASRAGQVIGVAQITAGTAMTGGLEVPVLGTGLGAGVWLALIGVFLSGAAACSYQHAVARDSLAGVPLRRILNGRPAIFVDAQCSIEHLMNNYVQSSGDLAYAVVERGALVGVVRTTDVSRIPRDRWPATPIAELAVSPTELRVFSADDRALEALEHFGQSDADEILIVDDGRLLGLLRRPDLTRWIEAASRTSPVGPPLHRTRQAAS